ncbi:MAG: sugar ABC transporter substrate-binding protein [Actinocatenispora sp.]
MATHRNPVSRRGLLRLGAAGVAAGVGGPLLAGCSRAPAGDSGGDKTFRIYWNAGHGYKTYEKVIKKFEADHGITVTWQKYQWEDLRTKLLTDIQAGNPPDLCEDDGSGWPVNFATTGDALALDDFIAKDDGRSGYPHDWQPSSLRNAIYRGRHYGVPLHLTCSLLFYNKAMLADAGLRTPPATWDEFLTAARKLTHGNQYGVALNSDPGYAGPWFEQNGVRLYDPATKRILTPRDAAVEAMQFQSDLIYKHKVGQVPAASSDYSGPQKLMSARRAAMIISGPWDIAPIRTDPKFPLGLALPLEGEKRATILAGAGMFIPAKSKHPELAWDLITRFTALETEFAVTKEVGVTMPRKSWASSSRISGDPLIGTVAESLKYGQNFAQGLGATGKQNEVSDAYKSFYQAVILSGREPADELPAFAARAEKILGRS